MRDYFCGWYFKCQSEQQTFAVIPAMHRNNGTESYSIQVITEQNSWNVRFPSAKFRQRKGGMYIAIGENLFCEQGLKLKLHTPDLSVDGELRFGPLSPIRYDIMGPFRYVPFMECRHSVLSMKHTVNGTLLLNGSTYSFRDTIGYLEGDRGRSFPKEYAWTQCNFEDGSLMLSVADIPLGRLHFTGIIGVIQRRGKEYRLATYLGAKAIRIGGREIVVRQGESVLTVRLLEKTLYPLRAPDSGAMTRTIRENIACRASYCFQQNGQTLFSFETSKASFEYEYPN